MSIVFACAASHAPGMTAWTAAAPKEQADRFLGNYRKLGEMLAGSAEVAQGAVREQQKFVDEYCTPPVR